MAQYIDKAAVVAEIERIKKEECPTDTYNYVEWDFRLWTLEDANDGDVLVNGSNIFIFHFINDTRLMGYCHVNIDDGRFYDDLGKNECFCLIDAVVNPATKEQRDLLFARMKEAGYEWDADKKEFKEIYVIDEGKAEMDYCFTKMMNGEKVSYVLNEEDKERIKRIASFVWKNRKGDTDEIFQQEQDVKWLNSLICENS